MKLNWYECRGSKSTEEHNAWYKRGSFGAVSEKLNTWMGPSPNSKLSQTCSCPSYVCKATSSKNRQDAPGHLELLWNSKAQAEKQKRGEGIGCLTTLQIR